MRRGNGIEKAGENKLFNFRPVFFLAVFLCLGIVAAFCARFYGAAGGFLIVIPILSLFVVFLGNAKRGTYAWLCPLAMLVCAFFLGFLAFEVKMTRYQEREDVSGERYYTGFVTEKSNNDYGIRVVLDGITISGEKADGKLIAYLPASFEEELSVSDEVLLLGEGKSLAVNKENFSMQAKSIGKDIRYEVYADSCSVTGKRSHLFLNLYARMVKAIDDGMDEDAGAVTKGLLLGETSDIDGVLYGNIRRGGIAHIFAVSGLHVGALYAFIMALTSKTPLRRSTKVFRFALIAVLIFVYTGICGFSASVVRAALICLLSYACRLVGVKADFLQQLGGAAIFILLYSPTSLFEIGFQLSFSACLGIALLTKPIGQVFDEVVEFLQNRLPKKAAKGGVSDVDEEDAQLSMKRKIIGAARDFVSVSLAAQIGTAPLLLSSFGYVSGWALVLNCLFVPIVSAFYSVLLLLVLLACLLSSFSGWIMYVPNLIWSGLLLVFEVMDFSGFAIEGLAITGLATFLYYLGCTFFSDKWNLEKRTRRMLGGVCIIAFVAAMVALNV